MKNNNERIVYMCWDAPKYGKNMLFVPLQRLKDGKNNHNKRIDITTILYLYVEKTLDYDRYKNTFHDENSHGLKWGDGLTTRERIEILKQECSENGKEFKPLCIKEKDLPYDDSNNIIKLQAAIEKIVFPELAKLNPKELHIGLVSGTREMIYTWISLFATSKLTRCVGDIVALWRFSTKMQDDPNQYERLFDLEIDKNPYIDAIELKAHENKTIDSTVELEGTDLVKNNCLLNAPMLLMGERGIGKSTIVETIILPEKQRRGLVDKQKGVQTVICGQLDGNLAESELFGHIKGAFTDADKDKAGAIELANGGILFLDEIQDLPRPTQRKLLRVLQTNKFNRIGDPGKAKEKESHFQLVCASNRPYQELKEKLDPDFFDRIAVFVTKIKPLRELNIETIKKIWENRWKYCRSRNKNAFILPEEPDDFSLVKDILLASKMNGNIRDIEQLIFYIARDVYNGTDVISENNKKLNYKTALKNWQDDYNEKYASQDNPTINIPELLEQEKWDGMNKLLRKWLAEQSIQAFGTLKKAAVKMDCEPKTLTNARK